MQPITGCPSLFPRSHARSLISFPCGSPATVYYGETVAKNRVYHVPILADAHQFQRVYPFSTCLSPGSACGDVSLSSRGTTGYPPFGQSLSAALAHFSSRGLCDSSPTLCMRKLPCPHTARLLAVSIPSLSPRWIALQAGSLSPKLRTRSLPIAHVRVGNCWSHSRSRIQFPMFQSLNVTRQEWALPSTAFADLRPADGDTCRTNEAKVETFRK